MSEVTIEQAMQIAVGEFQAGRLGEAEGTVRQILAAAGDYPDALNLLGAIAGRGGRYAEAVELVRRAIAGSPGNASYQCNLGIFLSKLGQLDEAIGSFERALVLRPDYAEGLFNLGLALAHRGELERAFAVYEKGERLQLPVALKHQFALAYDNLGNAFVARGEFERGIGCYRRAVALKPDYAEAWDSLGAALQMNGEVEDAIGAHRRALAIEPGFARAHNNLGTALVKREEWEGAMGSFRRALEIKADYPEAHNGMGNVWVGKGEIDRGIESYRRALELRPGYGEAWNNLGRARLERGEIEGAIDSFPCALVVKPGDADTLNNLGSAFIAKRDLVKAEEFFRAGVAAKGDHVLSNWNLGILLLFKGDFERGLALHEWRRKLPEAAGAGVVAGAEWDGSDLGGKRILIYAEQAFGDVIQGARYVPMVEGRGGKAVLIVPGELKRLMGCLEGIEQLVAVGEPMPSYDVCCPIMSLPLKFGTTLGSIPARVPYLRCDREIAEKWRARMPGDDRLKVGICWTGRAKPDPHRAVPVEELAVLGKVEGVWFCSLQKPAAAGPVGMELADFSGELGDFAETAGLMENLDLIITIDTSIAHLAGAMGKRVWVLLKDVPDWRWMLDREDSPWYPTMRLFRQTVARDWRGPIERIVDELRALAGR